MKDLVTVRRTVFETRIEAVTDRKRQSVKMTKRQRDREKWTSGKEEDQWKKRH